MILFIFEGNKREPQLFSSMQKLFFPKGNEAIICSFGNNIYELYRKMQEMDGVGDVVSIFARNRKTRRTILLRMSYPLPISREIYLFFDYDFHNRNYTLEELNVRITSMLSVFDNETENGKLYINYPMVESIRYTKLLPDSQYWSYTVSRDSCASFKKISDSFSDYQSLDFICLPSRREPTESELLRCRNNWSLLKVQNVCKANYICSGQNCLPDTKESISQRSIFENQVKKFVNSGKGCHVGILNAFPLFLYEYFPS